MKKISQLHIGFILLLPLALGASYLASCFPSVIENFYTKKIYRFIGQMLSRLTGILPFSLGEIIVISSILLIIVGLISFLRHLTCENLNRPKIIMNYLKVLLLLISFTYFVFIFVWGLNYHRMPLSDIAKIDVRPSSVKELSDLCLVLIERGNGLRDDVLEDERGVMQLPKGKLDMLLRAHLGYTETSKNFSELGGTFGRPKGVIFSKAMSYMGISGIYFPFTAEANVNMDIPDAMLPSTTCHEMAHQRGFAREDEANYIAYLTSTMHPDVDFQYSGVLLALLHSMNALYIHDPESFLKLKSMYSEGLQRDLENLNAYWKKYEGPIERATTKVNDAYLKSNMQEDGVHSYGRMVDLLLAEQRSKQVKY
ncbi:hypothetical protein HNQ80_001789 [Anaerosolibacter carboniphilus]|uniref:DUF3810 domain-containing protein n=1 Tax=Anaerosolibacter carboniphilus TaxID=1417629 RepID=A0A841KUL1_9FIRM|nr:DUF3810 domain-containing protein [Anaerosolibacter carboniphilus]MBB6215700.1 hypothetical protein [Anaerosolibacter carboniphilus]